MIELGRDHYTREDIEDIQKMVIQYFTLMGKDVSSFENIDEFLKYFLDSVDPKSKELH
jgi:hypothetical protein